MNFSLPPIIAEDIAVDSLLQRWDIIYNALAEFYTWSQPLRFSEEGEQLEFLGRMKDISELVVDAVSDMTPQVRPESVESADLNLTKFGVFISGIILPDVPEIDDMLAEEIKERKKAGFPTTERVFRALMQNHVVAARHKLRSTCLFLWRNQELLRVVIDGANALSETRFTMVL